MLAGDELEYIRPNVYRNIARQLNISLHSETVVTDAFLAVAAQIFTAGTALRQADRAGAGRNRMGPLLWDGCEVGPGFGKSRGQFGGMPSCNDLMSSSVLCCAGREVPHSVHPPGVTLSFQKPSPALPL